MKPIIFILTVTILLASCANENKAPEMATPDAKKQAMPMMMNRFETLVLEKSNPKVPLKLAGELFPDQQTALFAKVNSYVKTIHADIGSKVTAGQILIVLEAPEIQSQLANAKAKLQAQQAIYLATKSTYDRMVNANKTEGAIAKDALEQIKAKQLADEAQLEAAKSTYQELLNIDNYLIIRAPFSGVITARNVDVGAYVGPMEKMPLLDIQNTAKLRLNISIAEAQTPYLKIGDTIQFKVNSMPQKMFMARISRKAGTLDTKLRSEKIEADFNNTHNELKPFMVAETLIHLQHTEPTFFVPKSAIVESGMGVYVILIEHGKTKKLTVAKGRAMGDKFEIFGALNAGEKILKMGSEEIQEGIAVM